MSQTNILRITKIINEGLSEADFDFEIDPILSTDINPLNYWGLKNLIQFEDDKNPVNKIFTALSKSRYEDFGQFHHFKGVEIALQIIEKKSIQVSSLFSNDKNDFAEYTEFFKRTGLFHPLLPKDYHQQTNEFNPAAETPADIDRKNIFVLCFTQDNHNERFWTHYADRDNGIAIGFKFSLFNLQNSYLYDFRDVFYDKGYSFDFLNNINYKLRKEFGKILFAEGLTKFSKFYKRAKYNWENETRLCFHYDGDMLGHKHILENIFPIQSDIETGRNYIELPLSGNSKLNPFFNLEINEVVCGKHVSDFHFQQLKDKLANSFPKADIWRRK